MISLKNSLVLLFVSCSFAFTACQSDPPAPPDTATVILRNETYGPKPRNKMDVYLPKNRSEQTPFLILIHGGAWVAGDKADMNALQDSLLSRGIVSASINYEYATATVHFENLMQDVATALEYCGQQAEDWNTREDGFMMGGMSAGAHMALLYAYQYDVPQQVAGLISAAGPTDLANVDYLNYSMLIGLLDEIEKLVGAQYIVGQAVPARFSAASPLAHIRHVPTLLLHGDNDLVVPYAHSTLLAEALEEAGYPHKLVTFNGANHDLGLSNPVYLQLLLTEIKDWCFAYGQ